jgi:Lon protease-like protein
MSINKPYESPAELPMVIPVFPLPGVLLLPRGDLPLNIFEPRYLAMVDDALKAHRLIGMIQPASPAGEAGASRLETIGCAGRITQFAETGDGRYMLALTGIARYRILDELTVVTPYRQCRVDFTDFRGDLTSAAGEAEIDRKLILRTLEKFAKANRLRVDWGEVEQAPSEMLVNALSMMCPFGPGEKQALLEAPDLKSRADVLIAITEIDLARKGAPNQLQ